VKHWLTPGLLLAASSGCAGGLPVASTAPVPPSELHVFAEGPCSRLSVRAAGQRRFIVYGDHGRDFGGWMPGEEVAAAQTFAELRGGRAFRRPSLLRGLPANARGYVRGELQIGGTDHALWLVRTETRYSLTRRGPLFERTAEGYRFDGGWQRSDEAVSIPEAARKLPALPLERACGDRLSWIPIASQATPGGGLVVAGRCDDASAANLQQTTLIVARGRPGADRFEIDVLPETEVLDGIVNLDLFAASDDEIYVSAYEPYKERHDRHAYLARFDGERWRDLPIDLSDGIMAVSGDGAKTLWLAAGRKLYRLQGLRADPVALPPLRLARGERDLHVHGVSVLGGELWAEASYRVKLPGERGSHWASVLFSSRAPDTPLYCDAREPAETALVEVPP
jgi:hypothetical protein